MSHPDPRLHNGRRVMTLRAIDPEKMKLSRKWMHNYTLVYILEGVINNKRPWTWISKSDLPPRNENSPKIKQSRWDEPTPRRKRTSWGEPTPGPSQLQQSTTSPSPEASTNKREEKIFNLKRKKCDEPTPGPSTSKKEAKSSRRKRTRWGEPTPGPSELAQSPEILTIASLDPEFLAFPSLDPELLTIASTDPELKKDLLVQLCTLTYDFRPMTLLSPIHSPQYPPPPASPQPSTSTSDFPPPLPIYPPLRTQTRPFKMNNKIK